MGGRQAASEKCPWSVTTLRFFFPSSSGFVQHPLAKPTPGGSERIRNEWATRVAPRAFSLFSSLPSFLHSLPPSLPLSLSRFIPYGIVDFAARYWRARQVELSPGSPRNRDLHLSRRFCTTCRRHFTSLITDREFENRVSPHGVVIINTVLIGCRRKK